MWFPDLPSQAKVVHYLTRQGFRFQLADGNCVLVDAEWDRLRELAIPLRRVLTQFEADDLRVLFKADGGDLTTAYIGVTALICGVGFCFGGNFAMFPPITSEYFGTRFFGTNYGVVFTSYAVGGVLGGLMPGIIKGGFEWVFILTAVGSLAAFAVAWITKPPVIEPEAKPAST